MNSRKSLIHLAVAFALFSSYGAYAADTGALPCKTTEECAAQAAKVGATPGSSQSAH
ncbi:argininosuccinate lyase, partial [Pseudomonas sp. K5002]|nr:argininosuccinate lyase [Pseudomonas sp. K5002]